MITPKLKAVFIFLLFLSGACGLIYEVVWSRYLALFIGSSGYSHMIVLATFMGGLALGSFVFGKIADKALNPLKLYGLLEVGVGVYCVLFPVFFDLAGAAFINIAASQQAVARHDHLIWLKFLLSFVLLIVPTFLMGGTLPILVKLVTASIANSGRDIATLYSVNCFGAVVGTALAGLYLIRNFGMEATIWHTALFNILIGLVALALSRFVNREDRAKPANRSAETSERFSASMVRIAATTALITGVVAMVYELAWIRLLSNILGTTTYSFSVMLIAFISGIGIGSFIASLFIKKVKNLLGLLAFCQLGTALSMVLMLPLYERLPYFLLKIADRVPNTADYFPKFLFFEFLLCFLIMLIPTTFSGMSLPVVGRIANRDMQVLGKTIGGVFSINTIGSVAGALIAGLILIPQLGVKSTLEIGLVLNALLGVFILFKAKAGRWMQIGVLAVTVSIFAGYLLLFPSWNQNFLISGVYRNLHLQALPTYSEFKMQQSAGHTVLYYQEGIDANVAVRESPFGDGMQRSLVINGKADASTVADLETQVLLGQLPLMLHPNEGDVLVVGMGSGITGGAALQHPIRSLDVVELSREVVEANPWFSSANGNFMQDPRTRVFVQDAITQLKVSPKKYDHIISEPSNPWIAGIGNLYTVEFFELCKSRLNHGGVLTQWFHTYDVSDEIFEMVMHTISRVFPHVSIWKASDSDILILASAEPLTVDFEAMRAKFARPPIAKDLARINVFDVPSLLSMQMVSPRNNPYHYDPSGEINSTDSAALEYLAPLALFTHAHVSVLSVLDERFNFLDKNLWFASYAQAYPLKIENYLNIARYRVGSHVGDYIIAYSALQKALEMEPGNGEALAMYRQVLEDMRMPDPQLQKARIRQLGSMAAANPGNPDLVLAFIDVFVAYYQLVNSVVNPQPMDDAVALLSQSMQMSPTHRNQLQFIQAMMYTGAGRSLEAAEAFMQLNELQQTAPQRGIFMEPPALLFAIGESLYNAGKLVAAERYFRRVPASAAEKSDARVMLQKIERKESGIR